MFKVRNLILTATVIILVLLGVSCSMDKELPGEVYFCTVALDYKFTNQAGYLSGTRKDQINWVNQIKTVSGNTANITAFGCFENPPSYLQNNYVTPSMLKNYFENLEVNEEDVLIFHYSGHGSYDGSLCLNNSSDSSDKQVASLSPSTLLSWMKDLPCNIVLLMDSCYSGNFVPEDSLSDGFIYSHYLRADGTGKKHDMEQYKMSSFFKTLENAVKEYNQNKDADKMWVISACSDKQEAADSDKGGYLSILCLRYLGFDIDKNATTYQENKTYSVYGMYDYFRTYMRKYKSSDILLYTPQANFKPVNLILFRT